MKLILSLLLALTPFTLAEDWVQLFDGKTLSGWVNRGDANWTVTDGTITADSGKVSLLTTTEQYENYELELEFKAAIGTNSGVFLNTKAKVKDEAIDCYEINIADPTNPFPTGSVVKHVKVEGLGEKDEWRTYQLKVSQGTVSVTLDGKKLYEYVATPALPAGYIGLQKNKGLIAFRNIRIRKLD
ncbi:MAG: 3-keto-disaccharide hydrolase [Roseibacillus sp.]